MPALVTWETSSEDYGSDTPKYNQVKQLQEWYRKNDENMATLMEQM